MYAVVCAYASEYNYIGWVQAALKVKREQKEQGTVKVIMVVVLIAAVG